LSNKPLDHPIISSVIAGIILWIIAWLAGYIPVFWKWLNNLINSIYTFTTQDISIPLWLIILISIPLLKLSFKSISKSISSNQTEHNMFMSNQGEVQIVVEEDEEIKLSTQEDRVMRLFIEADGKSIKPDHLTYKLNTSNLKVEQILEALIDKELIESYRSPMYGTSFGLTREGRDYMMGNEF